MQVKVRALIWHGDRIVVHRASRRGGQVHLSLPGGRPKPREHLLEALAREVLEETGLHIRPGRLLYVAESVNAYDTQDVHLVFAAGAADPIDEAAVCLIDPREPQERPVFPPILDTIAEDAPGPPSARWLGNVWMPSTASA